MLFEEKNENRGCMILVVVVTALKCFIGFLKVMRISTVQ